MTNLKKVQSKVTDERVLLSYEKGDKIKPIDVSMVQVDSTKIIAGVIQAHRITINSMLDE